MGPTAVGCCDKLSVAEFLERGFILQIANEISNRGYAKPLRKLNI